MNTDAKTIQYVIKTPDENDFLSIEEVLNKSEIDQWSLRLELENHKWKCGECLESVILRGGRGGHGQRTLHFSHLRNSPGCPSNEGKKMSKEEIEKRKWNGRKEGFKHKNLKRIIEKSLRADRSFYEIKVEERQLSTSEKFKWRRPDVSCLQGDKKIVFEIQLSTTFLTVITGRSKFYKEKQTFLCWIFDDFSTVPSEQSFTDKDIIYSNNCNAFVSNEETFRKSIEQNELFLLCHYMVPKLPDSLKDHIKHEWNSEVVRFRDLTFDSENYQIFYYNHSLHYQDAQETLRRKRLEEKARIEKEQFEDNFEKDFNLLCNNLRWSYLEGYEDLRIYGEPIDKEELKIINQRGEKYSGWVKIISPNYTSDKCLSPIIGLEYFYESKRQNSCFYWYSNGSKKGRGEYKKGRLFSMKSWMPNGRECPISYLNSKGDGVIVDYIEDGSEKKRLNYKGGQPISS